MAKFLLDSGANTTAIFTEMNYESPLVQGGLEIPSLVKVEMHPTLRNIQLLHRFEELVKTV